MFIIYLIFAACLLISQSALYISPDKYWVVAFFGIAYPLFLAINILFVIYWAFRLKFFKLIIAVAIILLGWQNVITLVQWSSKGNPKDLKNTIKVMSYNVRNFDMYNYGKNWKLNTKNRNNIFNFLKKQCPDIVCFQEYVWDKSNQFVTRDSICAINSLKYYEEVLVRNSKKINYFGMAIFSKYPILNSEKILFDEKTTNSAMYSDILIDNDTVRVFNVHLASIRFGIEDYRFADDIKKSEEGEEIATKEEIQKKSKQILSRLKHAFIRRAKQARLVAEHIAMSPHKVILCGDFNDTHSSYAYHQLTDKLNDAFVEAGNGLGLTYAGESFPAFRIDFILKDPDMSAYNFEVFDVKYSDHYPIQCLIKLKE